MERRTASRKAGHRKVEASPEEMNGARLAEKTGAEEREHVVRTQQHAPESVDEVPVVGTVRYVLGERDGLGGFVRSAVDFNPDSKFVECSRKGGMKICHRRRLEHNR